MNTILFVWWRGVLLLLVIGTCKVFGQAATIGSKYGSHIIVRPVERSKPIPDARIEFETDPVHLDIGNNELEFNVNGFTLGETTIGEYSGVLANSAKGQHIHLIVDNEPYMAKYDATFGINLDIGDHVILAFLSRSYHESLKHTDAYIIKRFRIDDEIKLMEIDGPQLFYSRPKGTYRGVEGKNILLDFYLINAQLDKDKLLVRLNLDNVEYILQKWTPYIISGLEAGEHSISIELIDPLGHPVPGLFNHSGIRKFNIEN